LHPSPDSPSYAKLQSEHQSHQAQSVKFDLALARVSAAVEILSYAAMIFASSGGVFVVASMFTAFGGGSGPAMSSLAPALFALKGGKELGKLFGAIGVVQAICSQILGPFVYGMIYMNTVATFPKAMFYVTVAMFSLACVVLSLIQLRDPADVVSIVEEQPTSVPRPDMEREDTLVDVTPVIIVEDTDQTGKVVDR